MARPSPADGALSLDSIPPGEYTLSVSANKPGNQPWQQQAVASASITITVPASASPYAPIAISDIILKPVKSNAQQPDRLRQGAAMNVAMQIIHHNHPEFRCRFVLPKPENIDDYRWIFPPSHLPEALAANQPTNQPLSLNDQRAQNQTRPQFFDGYDPATFFDEMVCDGGEIRPHYSKFGQLFQSITAEEFHLKRQSVDLAFMRQGVTFNVYGDSAGTEKIFPFDLLPRIIPNKEWEMLERGLAQRITALNLFLHDLYHEQKILKDGVIPAHYVLSGKHFRREFVNFNVPKDIYIHICGTDLIRDDKGNYLVLEDNGRCPPA